MSDAEQQVGQHYSVCLCVQVNTRATSTDQIADTVNYAELCKLILAVNSQQHFRTLERFADACLEKVFITFQTVETAEITLKKLLPPIEAQVAATGVRLKRSRAEKT